MLWRLLYAFFLVALVMGLPLAITFHELNELRLDSTNVKVKLETTYDTSVQLEFRSEEATLDSQEVFVSGLKGVHRIHLGREYVGDVLSICVLGNEIHDRCESIMVEAGFNYLTMELEFTEEAIREKEGDGFIAGIVAFFLLSLAMIASSKNPNTA